MQYAGVSSSASATSRNASGESQPYRSCASRSAGRVAERETGIERPDLLDLVVQRRLLGAHRSTSPITASREPTTAIRSATAASVTQAAVACSAANEGARNLTRHGFGPPSETR